MAKRMISPGQKVLLCVLDGFGLRDEASHNAIKAARTPNLDRMFTHCPTGKIETSGKAVGLPRGQMGNSEVGHMTIGAGRIVLQTLPRIDAAIKDGTLEDNSQLQRFIQKMTTGGNAVHLMGLISDGGVHSHLNHVVALASIMARYGIRTYIHAFLDGRDTPPESGAKYLARLEKAIKPLENVSIATVGGRYFAMDRDKRWDRVEEAYRTMVSGTSDMLGKYYSKSAKEAVESAYREEVTDEFIEPTILGNYSGMVDGDGLLMANFRADRVRQLLTALLDPKFREFARPKTIQFSAALGMVEYSDALNALIPAIFPADTPKNTLGEVVSRAGLKQLRIAETEKYAHVTFFFNGGAEDVFRGEDRIMIPSPKVATYDLQPEMSAPEVTDRLVKAIGSGAYDLIVANYANTDMVGHTGDMSAAKKAVEAVDAALGRLEEAVTAQGMAMLITSDHGNAEEMYDEAGNAAHTQHTLNPVPLIAVNVQHAKKIRAGGLSDVAPTVLAVMGLPVPEEMTGKNLIS